MVLKVNGFARPRGYPAGGLLLLAAMGAGFGASLPAAPKPITDPGALTPRDRAEIILEDRLAWQRLQLSLIEKVQDRAQRGDLPFVDAVSPSGRALAGGLYWLCVGTSKGLVEASFPAPSNVAEKQSLLLRMIPAVDRPAWQETLETFTEEDWEQLGRGEEVSGLESPGWTLALSQDPQGLKITGVKPGSVSATLTVGQVLTHFEGQKVRARRDVETRWNQCAPGSFVQVRLWDPAARGTLTRRLEVRRRAVAGLRLDREGVRRVQGRIEQGFRALTDTLETLRTTPEEDWTRFHTPTIHAVATVEWSTSGRGNADPRRVPMTQHVRPRLTFPAYPRSRDVWLPPTREDAIEQLTVELGKLGESGRGPQDLVPAWERLRLQEGLAYLKQLTDSEYHQRVTEALERGPVKPLQPLPPQSPVVWLGADVEPVAPADRFRGQPAVKVTGVKPGSPAAAAGLKKNDHLTKLEQCLLKDPSALTESLEAFASGSVVKVEGWRDKKFLSLRVTLQAKP